MDWLQKLKIKLVKHLTKILYYFCTHNWLILAKRFNDIIHTYLAELPGNGILEVKRVYLFLCIGVLQVRESGVADISSMFLCSLYHKLWEGDQMV